MPAPPRLVVDAALTASAESAGTLTRAQMSETATANPVTALDVADTLDASGPWRLDYLLQARDDPSLLVPLEAVWRERGATARFLDRRFDHPHEHVLTSLGQAARLFEPIERSLHQSQPVGCALTGREAYDFLRQGVPLLEEAGFGVQVPAWWKRVAPRPNVRLRPPAA